MSWNNGYETKKFEARQKKQAEEYRALGMTEEQIQAMYEFDLEQFKSERRHRIRQIPRSSLTQIPNPSVSAQESTCVL